MFINIHKQNKFEENNSLQEENLIDYLKNMLHYKRVFNVEPPYTICEQIQSVVSVCELHKKTFEDLRHKYYGKEVVICATGPSLDYYKPIKNAIHIGVNMAFKSSKIKTPYGSFDDIILNKLDYKIFLMRTDTKYYSKPKVKKLMTEKTSIVKKVIDMICLIHNENEFKSIVPHPQFQNKGYSSKLIELEIKLLDVVQEINNYIDWEKIDLIKEFLKHLINKILNQEKEGIKQLKDDEYHNI